MMLASHPAPNAFAPSPARPSSMTSMASMASMTSSITSLPIMAARPPQRPKLTVNTHQPRVFGKAASLRLDALNTASPTVRNTFSNAYEPATTTNTSNTLNTYDNTIHAPTTNNTATTNYDYSTTDSTPKLRLDICTDFFTPATNTSSTNTPDSASTLSSTLTSASSDSLRCSIPYKQPHNLNSILVNSRIVPRKMASRPMFPAEKRVSFRTPLEEDITTVKYVWASSDLESSTSTLASLESVESASTASSTSSPTAPPTTHRPTPKLQLQSTPQAKPTVATIENPLRQRKPPRLGDKRDSSESDSDSDTCPQTPVAGRRKRSRDWRWTLGKLPGDSTTTSTASTASTSDEESS